MDTKTVELMDDQDPIEYYFEKGLTDGLPVVPPTEDRVRRMLVGTKRKPDEVIGLVAPNYRKATVEKIAVYAVMSGCLPEYMPVIIAGIEAMCEDEFNLHGIQSTTHFVSPLFIINGPIRNKINLNCGMNVFGQGFRANATIGRALRLVMVNIGGAKPGEISRSTLGHPGKYTYCIGENEEESPWESLSVERGFKPDMSTISVFAGESPHGINDHSSRTPEELVSSLGLSMACIWNYKNYLLGETVLVISPEHARTIAEGGWSKEMVREFIFERVRKPVKELIPDEKGREGLPEKLLSHYPQPEKNNTLIPKFESRENIIIVVAGGRAGRFSACIPGWMTRGWSKMVTKVIEE